MNDATATVNDSTLLSYLMVVMGLSRKDAEAEYQLSKPLPPVKPSLEAFWHAQSAWSQSTFGSDSVKGPIGALKHLAKEVAEVLAAPDDLEEYADLQFLVFDATRRAGFSYDDMVEACHAKLAKNKARSWPAPTAGDEPVEHIKVSLPIRRISCYESAVNRSRKCNSHGDGTGQQITE